MLQVKKRCSVRSKKNREGKKEDKEERKKNENRLSHSGKQYGVSTRSQGDDSKNCAWVLQFEQIEPWIRSLREHIPQAT